MEMPTGVTARFVGTFFVVSGIATLAQTTFGNRYPLVQGRRSRCWRRRSLSS